MVLRRDLLTIHLDPGGSEPPGFLLAGKGNRWSLVVARWSLAVGSQNPKIAAVRAGVHLSGPAKVGLWLALRKSRHRSQKFQIG